MGKQQKKYTVDYHCCSTGYGWSIDYDRLSEFESFVNDARHERSYEVWVYDHELDDFIFIKRGGTFDCQVDLLHKCGRDMRTTTRHRIPATERR